MGDEKSTWLLPVRLCRRGTRTGRLRAQPVGTAPLKDLCVGSVDADDVRQWQQIENAGEGGEYRWREGVFVFRSKGGRESNVHRAASLRNRHSSRNDKFARRFKNRDGLVAMGGDRGHLAGRLA